MSDRVPPGQLRILTARDRHVCVWTGEDSDRLVPQHRQGGMGGRAHKHRTANLIWLDSEINGLIEADANWQAAAKAFGIKISIHADPEKLPVFFQHEHAWFMLEGDSRREIPTGEAIARMHAFYGDEFYAWMTVARESTSFRALYLRGAR